MAGTPGAGSGRLGGIARHGVAQGPIETIERVAVSISGGIAGDARGVVPAGGRGRRQVTLIAAEDWRTAMIELDADLDWSVRRANLLVEGLSLPRDAGAVVRIGADVALRVTIECDPCRRMDAIRTGLQAALRPDWRGGVCARVIAGGEIAVGDLVRVEPADLSVR